MIYAPQEVLDTITAMYTNSVTYHELTDSLSFQSELQKYMNVKAVPNRVKVKIFVEQLTEKTLEVPVNAINVPEGKVLRTFPAKVKVTFQTILSYYKNVNPNNFIIQVDYNDIVKNPSSPAKPTVLAPSIIKHMRISPKEVDYLLEDELCHLMNCMGNIPIYQCDEEAKRLNVENSVIRRKFIKLMGKDVYNVDGSLNKSIVIDYLFSCKNHADKINSIVHPIVLNDFLKWAERQEYDIVGLEAALLFEANYQDSLNYTILVTAPEDLRIRRILKRDNITVDAAKSRIRMQSTDEEKRKLADFIIVNDEQTPLEGQIEKLLEFLRSKTL